MKHISSIIVLCICLSAAGQSVVTPRGLQVTMNKTTNLIFPATVISVDRGSERIVVQKSTANILRVKADTLFSDTTNLSVITSDGKLYSFLISYSASPQILNIDLGAGSNLNKDTALVAIANSVLKMKNNLHGLQYSESKTQLSITGVYTNSEFVICKLRIENNSSLSFEFARLRCIVTTTGSVKRKPVQEMDLQPLLVQLPVAITKENQSSIIVVIFPKAALATKQALQIDVTEKGGERHLSLRLPNKYILKATLLK